MAALVYYETRLQRHALDESLEAFESSKPKGMPKRLGLDTRVLRLVERAGDVGITHSRVIKAIRPALPSATVREAAQRLVARGIIEARIVKPSAGGRPGERYFAAA